MSSEESSSLNSSICMKFLAIKLLFSSPIRYSIGEGSVLRLSSASLDLSDDLSILSSRTVSVVRISTPGKEITNHVLYILSSANGFCSGTEISIPGPLEVEFSVEGNAKTTVCLTGYLLQSITQKVEPKESEIIESDERSSKKRVRDAEIQQKVVHASSEEEASGSENESDKEDKSDDEEEEEDEVKPGNIGYKKIERKYSSNLSEWVAQKKQAILPSSDSISSSPKTEKKLSGLLQAIRCSLCNKNFKSESSLNDHNAAKHSTRP